MAGIKTIDKETYKWAHLGVIIYHIFTATLLIISQYYPNMLYLNPRTVVMFLAILLLISSILAVAPVSTDYTKLIIE